MAVARKILDDPPPLTPAALRQFPFSARPFPFASLSQDAKLTLPPGSTKPRPASDNRVE